MCWPSPITAIPTLCRAAISTILLSCAAGVKGLKIAYSPNLGYVDVDPEVEAAVAEAARVLAELGAEGGAG